MYNTVQLYNYTIIIQSYSFVNKEELIYIEISCQIAIFLKVYCINNNVQPSSVASSMYFNGCLNCTHVGYG